MPETLIPVSLQRTTPRLTTSVRRYCGDWLAQFLWAIGNNLEEPVNLYGSPQPYDPRPRGSLDSQAGVYDPDVYLRQPRIPEPQLTAYVCYLPPETRLDFEGKRVYLYAGDVPLVHGALKDSGLLAAWTTYQQGGTYQIYSFHRASGSMQLTPKARVTPGIGRAAEVLAEWFERQIVWSG